MLKDYFFFERYERSRVTSALYSATAIWRRNEMNNDCNDLVKQLQITVVL
jgi:hypothetical protein